MFLRCVIISNKLIEIEKLIKIGLVSFNKKHKIRGNDTPANIEDNDTILEVSKTTKKTIKAKAHAVGNMQITIPKIVATPFPPLKPAKTGKI